MSNGTTEPKGTAILLGVELALTVLEKLLPDLLAGIKSGTITTDQQKNVMRRVASIRTDLQDDGKFSGPEWET